MTLAATPALAQNAASGPVHLPPPGASAAANATNAVTTIVAPVTVPPAQPATAAVSPKPVTAPAAAGGDNGDIHDIRGPIEIPYPLLWALYILGALAVAGLLYAVWRWLRRPKARVKQPHELALDRLEAARGLMTEGQVREYAFAVSEVIRYYIEQRFGERAARRTTEEFLSDLLRQTGTPLAGHHALLEDFLNHCDLPKFARWQLSVREMESMHESARAFILNTRPDAARPAASATPELAPAPTAAS
ncbi:MAG: DUF4381 family protein [Verrucomicrobiota bacterium]